MPDTSHPPVPQANREMRLSKAVIMVVQAWALEMVGTLIQIPLAAHLFPTLNLI